MEKKTVVMYQYYCKECGYEREGLLDTPAGIGGGAHNCPRCKNVAVRSREVEVEK